MTWLRYFWAVLLFATVGFASTMAVFMTQAWLPLNPQKLPNCSWHLAFMQAWSFTCNADWQSYAGETTMSYFSQVFGVMVPQSLSPWPSRRRTGECGHMARLHRRRLA